jgi:hypothetical protein
MSQSDPLLVETRSRYTVLVIDGHQPSGCNALEALRGNDVTWVTSLTDAREVLAEKKIDFILSGTEVAGKRGAVPSEMVPEIIRLALRHNAPLCFVASSDENGVYGNGGHMAMRAASVENLAETVQGLRQSARNPAALLGNMRCSCTYVMPEAEKSPPIWLKALEMLQAMCLSPSIEPKPVKANGRRLTPVPRK